MHTYYIEFTLQSDAIFARGDGIAGLVDIDVQHDAHGLPYLAGRTLKGLLVQECADILESIQQAGKDTKPWEEAAARLFGVSGGQESLLSVGDATLPESVRKLIAYEVENGNFTPEQILASLTTIRRQTAMDPSGVPKAHTLRSVRAILRETLFRAPVHMTQPPNKFDLPLLAASVRALRRAGTSRNRGFGRLKDVKLLDDSQNDITEAELKRFFEEVEA